MIEFTDHPPYKWKTVRVFISSTFRDFHAERDYLIKYVFPELRQWCEKQKLHLIDIDLRWGVTEKEAESGKVIELCLEQIDGCRPFFICMLGSRYGWIPNKSERNKVNRKTLKNFPDLKVNWKNLSVTHLEILHAALSPFHGEEPAPHSFFYFRDKKSLPGENEHKLYSTEQRKEYLETFLEEDPQKTEKLESLKEDIEAYFEKDKDGRVFPYTPKFDISIPNPEDDNLKGRFTGESLGTFGNKVKEHLLHALEIQFAGRIQYLSEIREEDSLENERDLHEVFIENRTTLFIGRTNLLKRIHDYVNSDSNKILAVYGESGSGKSALLAKFYREYKYDVDGNEIKQEVLFIPHFIGASPSSSAIHGMLRRFCEELFDKLLEKQMEERLEQVSGNDDNANKEKEKIRKEYEISFDLNKLVLTFKDFLEKAKSKVIILIDGVNQLDETGMAQELDWLPYELPENVKIIASTLEGKAQDSLKGLTNEQVDVGELDQDERREIIREMPSVFAKTLEEKHINVLLRKKATSNPLYLKVALEELRIFGSFEKLEEKVSFLPDTVIDMFVDVIERLEIEGDKELVKRLFCLVECSRYGLTESELEELLIDDKKEHIIIIRQLRDYFISKDGLIDFFHRGLSKAVRQKYDLENESIHWHKILAEYFAEQPHFFDGDKQKKPNVHKCLEQPLQEIKAKMWDEVTETLCDLNFIQAKCSVGMSYDLVNDFNAALELIPDNADVLRKEKERRTRLDKYAKDLVLYSKGEIKKLDVPESITPWSEEKTNAEIARIKNNPGRADVLKDYYNFLGHEVDNLHKHAREIPHFATQQAWNYSDSGFVGEAAEKKPNEILNQLLLRTPPTRPSWNPFPQALKTLKGNIRGVAAVAITPDGKMALSDSNDNTCVLWDLESGMPSKTLTGHHGSVQAVAITPDGKLAVSGSRDTTCKLWNLENGMPLRTLKGHTGPVGAVAITADGKKALSGSDDNTCILWDLESGLSLKNFKGHTDKVTSVAITADGKKAVSGSEDFTSILWDLESGLPLKNLKGHSKKVTSVAITPDGKLALSGCGRTCILWNLENGLALRFLMGYNDDVGAVAITTDGKKAIFGSADNTCILWNLENGMVLKTLIGHVGGVGAIAITPDGKMALSGSGDNTCILWDLESGLHNTTLHGHSHIIMTLAVTPDGKKLVTGSWDKTCILWDIESGVPLKALKGHTGQVHAVAITPDGNNAVSGSGDNTCILWELDSGKALKIYRGHNGGVTTIAITHDGTRVLSGAGDNTCILWDLESGLPLKTFTGHTDTVTDLAISHDGKIAFSGSRDGTCILWDMESAIIIKIFKGHIDYVEAVSLTNDGKMAISGSWDNTCILWNLESGLQIKTLEGHNDKVAAVEITPDGKMALSGSQDNTCILWDIETGLPVKTLKGHTRSVFALALSPDGKMALSGSGDKSCILWDLESGLPCKTYKEYAEISSALALTRNSKMALSGKDMQFRIHLDLERNMLNKTLKGRTSPIGAVAITPDGKMALSGTDNETCLQWDLESGQLKNILRGHSDWVRSVAICPDGKMALSGSNDHTCILWDLETGLPNKFFKAHTGVVWAIAISGNGKMALSGSKDETCILWDLESGLPLKTLKGHKSDVHAVAITPDGKVAVSGSSDHTCILWDLVRGLAIITLKGHSNQVNSVAISSDGKLALSGSDDKTCILWDLVSGKKLSQFFNEDRIFYVKSLHRDIFGGSGPGNNFMLQVSKKLVSSRASILTAEKIWNCKHKSFMPPSADCPFCATRFSPPESVLETIEEITENAGLLPEQSACLELPNEFWEGPGLLSICPQCGEELKFNPFITFR